MLIIGLFNTLLLLYRIDPLRQRQKDVLQPTLTLRLPAISSLRTSSYMTDITSSGLTAAQPLNDLPETDSLTPEQQTQVQAIVKEIGLFARFWCENHANNVAIL